MHGWTMRAVECSGNGSKFGACVQHIIGIIHQKRTVTAAQLYPAVSAWNWQQPPNQSGTAAAEWPRTNEVRPCLLSSAVRREPCGPWLLIWSVKPVQATEASAAKQLHVTPQVWERHLLSVVPHAAWTPVTLGDRETARTKREKVSGATPGLCTSVAAALDGFSSPHFELLPPLQPRTVRLSPSSHSSPSSVLPKAFTRKRVVYFLLLLCPRVVWMGCNNREGGKNQKRNPTRSLLPRLVYCTVRQRSAVLALIQTIYRSLQDHYCKARCADQDVKRGTSSV